MRAIRAAIAALVVFGALAGVGCRSSTPASARCELPERLALDARGRPDGVYGVSGDAIDAAPLARFEALGLSSTGVDEASGKRWLRLHAAPAEAATLGAFTSRPEGRSMAVVIGGEVACHHKIRAPVTSADFQVSCCNPAACDRWLTMLKR